MDQDGFNATQQEEDSWAFDTHWITSRLWMKENEIIIQIMNIFHWLSSHKSRIRLQYSSVWEISFLRFSTITFAISVRNFLIHQGFFEGIPRREFYCSRRRTSRKALIVVCDACKFNWSSYEEKNAFEIFFEDEFRLFLGINIIISRLKTISKTISVVRNLFNNCPFTKICFFR